MDKEGTIWGTNPMNFSGFCQEVVTQEKYKGTNMKMQSVTSTIRRPSNPKLKFKQPQTECAKSSSPCTIDVS